MRFLILALALASVFVSCKKDNIDAATFWECHQSLAVDSVTVYQKLQSTWKWDRQRCASMQGNADKNITISLMDGGSYILKEGASVIAQGTWSIQRYGSGGWSLSLSTPAQYFYGEILFCKDEVLFHNTPVDGCDNIFKKL